MSISKTLSSAEATAEYLECDLCGEMQLCTERSELVACRTCQADHLPSGGVF